MRWSDLQLRLRALLRPRRVESELDEELRFHLALEQRKLRAAGMDPLAVRDPYSLYTWGNSDGGDRRLSWHEYLDFQKQTRAFADVNGSSTLVTRTEGHIMLGNLVTGNYFQMLGVNAAMGRTLLPED